jgi:hypothetical protein
MTPARMKIKLKKAKTRIQELAREGQIIRQRGGQPLSIPIMPFLLALFIGAVTGYLVFDSPFQGVFWGLGSSLILFFTMYDS